MRVCVCVRATKDMCTFKSVNFKRNHFIADIISFRHGVIPSSTIHIILKLSKPFAFIVLFYTLLNEKNRLIVYLQLEAVCVE